MLLKRFLSKNKILLLFITILFIWGCNTHKDIAIIKFESIKEPVILRLSKSDSTIILSKIPQKIEISSKSNFKIFFNKINYIYSDSLSNWRNLNIQLFKKERSKLIRILNNKKKSISKRKKVSLVYYTRHFIDSTKIIQKEFKPYVEKMLAKNQDTLHIGTVADFKQKHKDLFEKLTKNDSISIQFLDNDKLGERITVPVKWD